MRAFNHARPLAWAALMAGLMTAMGDATADASGSPGIFEVDALFPRNETYAPQVLMPIVFALQNPALASPLAAYMTWALWEGNNYTSPGSVPGGSFEPATMDFSSNDPYLFTRIVNTLAYPDGFWTLFWEVTINNCSQLEGHSQPITMNNTVVFTISRSAQTPDLVAATSADKCGTTDAYAFNATSFGDTCGVLGSSPTTNPCAATINPSAASSIYAESTAAACSPLYRQQNPNVTCPTPSTADAAGRSRMAAASTLLTVLATLTVLFHLG